MTCPFCASRDFTQIQPVHQGECITSDMSFVPESRIDNRLCNACGFIWNEGGPRGQTDEFYARSYQLRMHTNNAQNINFSATGTKPMAQAVAEFLVEQGALGESGTILEAGAGKGEFLLQFMAVRPNWTSTAFEPSTAVENLRERLPQTTVHHGGYQQMAQGQQFDVVASLAVIEHVENSYEFMDWLRGQMTDKGHLLLTFPDFARNPNDVFCVDHLSKIAMPQLLMMAAKAGLELVAHTHVGIAMLALLRKTEPAAAQASVASEALAIALRNEALAAEMVAAVTAARNAAATSGEKFAIFGLGMAGLVAPVLSHFARADITAYIDENPTMHGLKLGDVPVVDLADITALGIRHVALSVSPIYREQVTAKLEPFGVKIYA